MDSAFSQGSSDVAREPSTAKVLAGVAQDALVGCIGVRLIEVKGSWWTRSLLYKRRGISPAIQRFNFSITFMFNERSLLPSIGCLPMDL